MLFACFFEEKKKRRRLFLLFSQLFAFKANLFRSFLFRRSLTMVKYARDPINGSKSCKARGRYVGKKKRKRAAVSSLSLIESSRRRSGDRRSSLFFKLRLARLLLLLLPCHSVLEREGIAKLSRAVRTSREKRSSSSKRRKRPRGKKAG